MRCVLSLNLAGGGGGRTERLVPLMGSKHVKFKKSAIYWDKTRHANFRGNPFYQASYETTLAVILVSDPFDERPVCL